MGAHNYALASFIDLLHSIMTASLPLELLLVVLLLLLRQVIYGDWLIHHAQRMVHRLLLI